MKNLLWAALLNALLRTETESAFSTSVFARITQLTERAVSENRQVMLLTLLNPYERFPGYYREWNVFDAIYDMSPKLVESTPISLTASATLFSRRSEKIVLYSHYLIQFHPNRRSETISTKMCGCILPMCLYFLVVFYIYVTPAMAILKSNLGILASF